MLTGDPLSYRNCMFFRVIDGILQVCDVQSFCAHSADTITGSGRFGRRIVPHTVRVEISITTMAKAERAFTVLSLTPIHAHVHVSGDFCVDAGGDFEDENLKGCMKHNAGVLSMVGIMRIASVPGTIASSIFMSELRVCVCACVQCFRRTWARVTPITVNFS